MLKITKNKANMLIIYLIAVTLSTFVLLCFNFISGNQSLKSESRVIELEQENSKLKFELNDLKKGGNEK